MYTTLRRTAAAVGAARTLAVVAVGAVAFHGACVALARRHSRA
ncbi:hypothetical protein WJ438_33655 [Streptomyces sp. GD-15H]